MEETLNGFTGFAQRRNGSARIAPSAASRAAAAAMAEAEASRAAAAPAARGVSGVGADAVGRAATLFDAAREPLQFSRDQLQAIPECDRRWAWMEIDQNAIIFNVQAVRRVLGSGVRVMAVLNADAYGHGAVRMAKTALNAGVDYLAVATVDEAVVLREALISAPILVLTQPPMTAIPLLLGYKVMPAVYTPDFAIQYGEMASAYGVSAPYHLAVNTGLNRQGVRFSDVVEFMRQVNFHRALDLKGVFTQFSSSSAHGSADFQKQYRRFLEALGSMQAAGFGIELVHCADSAAALCYPDVRFNMVRIGQALYGIQSSVETRRIVDLRPVMSVHARVSDARLLPMGENVSYGNGYRSSGGAKICTVPVGYGDGFPRSLSGKAEVLCRGVRCHQVGDVCMDMLMFEADARSYSSRMMLDPQMGDEVVLVGQQGEDAIALEDVARAAGLLPTELACGFGLRLPRVYV